MPDTDIATTPSAKPLFRAPPPWVVYLFLALGLAAVASAFFIPLPKGEKGSGGTNQLVAPPVTYDYVPEFSLSERAGRKVTHETLRGRVWVASFVFTRCKMGCPSITSTMTRLQTELNLAGRDDLRLVTFTVDPERDGVKELQEYAEQVAMADKAKWLFLTSDNGEYMRALARSGFKLTAQKKANPQPGDEFDHSTKLVVVDKLGRIRRHFDGKIGANAVDDTQFENDVKDLKELVEVLAKE